jgi:DNA replication protein DnaC
MNDIALLKEKLKRLKLPGFLDTLEERLKQASKEKWAYTHFLDRIASDEIERREYRQQVIKLSTSNLEPSKTLETFDFSFNAKIHAPLIKELAFCNFIKNKETVIIVGPSGVGKSHLAHALGHEALRRGYGVLFYKTYHLFQWLQKGRGDGSFEKKLSQIIKIPLLILDDFGLQPLSEFHQEDLYEVICERYERNATIITSNRDFSEWHSVFANPLIASAALDRLIHRATRLSIDGKSYRVDQFARREKKLNKMEEK